jgi:hypothetical protein
MSIRDISSGALWRCIILFSILFIVLSYNLLDDRYSHFARWYFFDIGQGDATLFETGEGSFFLFDAGPDRTIAKRLDRFLPSLHKSVDLIFISHPQKDHFNGIFSLFTSYRIGAIVYNGAVVDSDGWNNVVHEANRLHIPLIPVMSGDSIRHGGTVISILNPTFSTLQSAESNDTGLVALAEQGDFSVLLTADIGSDVERLLRVFYFVRREHVAEIKSIFTNKSVLFSGLFAGLTIDSSIHTIFFILFTIKIFFLIYILDLYLNFYKKNIIDLQNFIRKIFSKIIENIYIIFLSLLVNISFLINTILGKNEIAKFTEKAISSLDLNAFQTIGGNIFEKIFNVLSLTGFWGREQFRFIDITDNPLWFLGFLPFVFLIIFGIYKMYFANFKLFLISILFIVFVPILAVATSIESLDFMYKYIPFYTGLREPHKWTMLLIPIYLIAMFFGLRNTSHLENKNSVIIFFILLLFIFQYKFLFGFWGQMRAVEYPSSWYKIEEIIKKENLEKYSTECAGENLFLPWHLYMSFKFAGNVIANPATYFFSCPIVSGTNMEFGGIFDNNKNDTSTKYGFWLFEDNKNLPPNETNFIIVSKDVDFERYNWLRERGFIQNIFEDDNLILYKVKN